jgi:hypothetical protein
MDWKQEQKIIKMIERVAEEVQMIGQTLDNIEGVSTHARNSKFELLHIISLFKLNNEKQEHDKKEQEENKMKQEPDKTEQEQDEEKCGICSNLYNDCTCVADGRR